MLNLTVQRTRLNETCTIGELIIDGVHQCYTLEDKVREIPGVPVSDWKIAGQTAIPAGSYKLGITQSSHFRRLMPILIGVPGYSGVRIHWGNKDEDTDGCILVGNALGEDGNSLAGGSSRPAFDALFPKLQAAIADGRTFITIRNP